MQYSLLLSLLILSTIFSQAHIGKISEVHDVAVLNIIVYPTRVVPRDIIHFDITVENQGTVDENFNLTIYTGNHTIYTMEVIDLAPSINITFSLNCGFLQD